MVWKIGINEMTLETPRFLASFYARDDGGFEICSVVATAECRDNLSTEQILDVAMSAQSALQRRIARQR